MAVSNKDRWVDFLNIRKSDEELIKSELLNVLNPYMGRLPHLAELKREMVENFPVATANLIPQLALMSGLISLILKCKQGPLGQLSQHFLFFARYFVLAWNISDENERKTLIGSLESGLKDERALMAFYFELIVASIYMYKGNQVSFIDLVHKEEPSYDFVISKNGLKYHVEVKTIEFIAGLPFDAKWMREALTGLLTSLDPKFKSWTGYHVNVRYVGKRQPTYNEISSQMRRIAELLSPEVTAARTPLFDVGLRQVEADHSDRLMEKLFLEEGGEYFYHVKSVANSVPGIASLTSEEPWKLPEKIASVIKDVAKRQLPKGGRSILWIQLIGSTGATVRRHERLHNLVANDSLIVKELRKRQGHLSGTHGLTGLHLVGDPFTFRHQDEEGEGLDVPDVFFTSSTHEAEANIYMFGILNRMYWQY